MTESDALYRAILAQPEEDTPRLVYADWLQENDRPEEAEFIRIGCRLQAESPAHPEYTEWLARKEELTFQLGTHNPGPKPVLAGGLKVASGEDWWRISNRGFPRYLEYDADLRFGLKPIKAVAAGLTKAFAVLPSRWFVMRWVTANQLAHFLRCPVVEQIDTLTLQLRVGDVPHDDAARLLSSATHLRNLRGASLAFDIGEDGALALAASENLGRMQWLKLQSSALTPAAVRALAAAPWFRNLRSLRLDDLSPDAFDELSRSSPFPHLHTLELGGTLSAFPPAVWRRITQSKAFPQLTRLVLGSTGLGIGGAESLSRPLEFRLTSLDLSWNALSNDGAEWLAQAPWFDSLRWLTLRGNMIGPTGAKALLGSRKLAALQHLDVSYNPVGVGGLRAIAGNPALRGLIALNLSCRSFDNGPLNTKHFQDFFTRMNMPELRNLSLFGRPVGGRAVRLLTQEKFQNLTRLNLRGCRLTDNAVSALLQSRTMDNLIELDLSDNGLSEGVKPLTNTQNLPKLAKCYLSGNPIPNSLLKQLTKRAGVLG